MLRRPAGGVQMRGGGASELIQARTCGAPDQLFPAMYEVAFRLSLQPAENSLRPSFCFLFSREISMLQCVYVHLGMTDQRNSRLDRFGPDVSLALRGAVLVGSNGVDEDLHRVRMLEQIPPR